MSIEAMKTALEALEEAHPKPYNESVISHVEAITALRTAIAEAESVEPVAWVNLDKYGNLHESSSQTVPPWTFPVYRHPPAAQQEPVALEAVYETIIHWDEGGGKRSRRELARRIVSLYTTPPAAQRQPLTEERVWELAANCLDSVAGRLQFARAIEAAHGITGEKK